MVKNYKACVFLSVLCACCSISIASATTNAITNTNTTQEQSVQSKKEWFFHIMPYEATYVLPFYYVSKPYEAIYRGNIPYGQQLQHHEVKFQFSVMMPFLKDIFGYPLSLYGAYTQLSFWQAYTSSAWFRETNYIPRVFLSYKVNRTLIGAWRLTYINAGAVHQSNGRGGDLERSWNRFYVEMIVTHNNFSFMLSPWLVQHDKNFRQHNPEVKRYLGNGKFVAVYRIHGNTFALQTHNTMHGYFKPISGQLTWSFSLPYIQNIKGYIQAFTGYGQSLIEADHRTNAIGIGLALNDVDLGIY